MKLHDIIKSIDNIYLNTAGKRQDPEIVGIVSDHRQVKPGMLFAALAGAKFDGTMMIDAAIHNGATAILTFDNVEQRKATAQIATIHAQNPRQALGQALARFYHYPADQLKLIGVTGTNGKTTTTSIIQHIIKNSGHKCGLIGTVLYDTVARQLESKLTTPGAVEFTQLLAEMVQSQASFAVAEISSHALDQERIYPHKLAAAVFTNLTRDHLDYHHSFENYLLAKQKMFNQLDSGVPTIVNSDDIHFPQIVAHCQGQIIRYSLENPLADYYAVINRADILGCQFTLYHQGQQYPAFTPLTGRYNLQNSLAAIAAVHANGFELRDILAALASFPAVPGRLERIVGANQRIAFVDYAHTDDALSKALETLRPLTRQRLLVVFGCGGDRDPGKRPLMARAAELNADKVYVTSDNPRSEDPQIIIDQIVTGFVNRENVTCIVDRETAIRSAVSEMQAGDVVLIAGKGHENYQIVKNRLLDFDDRLIVHKALTFFTTGQVEEFDLAGNIKPLSQLYPNTSTRTA